MRKKRALVLSALMGAVPGWLLFMRSLVAVSHALLAGSLLLLAAGLFSCTAGDRVAGSSTEAGNAGGKLSLKDGSPAAGVSVALVARSYVPDTAGFPSGDKDGAFYRTRTGSDGRFFLEGVKPGHYRVMAVGEGGGVMSDSVVVEPGPDTVLFSDTLKPLGAIHGVAKLVGSEAKVNVWVRPAATVKAPPLADSVGGFRLDSLPEGEYDLLPQCYSCAEPEKPYRVKVQAGKDSLLPDTLKLYPEIMSGFPDSGEYQVRASQLPLTVGGKWHKALERHLRPTSAVWTWNGQAIPGEDFRGSEGMEGTSATLDSSSFRTSDTGRLRVVLIFPDTMVSRLWTLGLDRSRTVHPLQGVEADSAVRVSSLGKGSRWRVRVANTKVLERADVSFWGLESRLTEPNPARLPDWITLGVADERDSAVLLGTGPGKLTFILLPDSSEGGSIFRPRRDERLADLEHIRLFDRSKMGFGDSLVPTMTPDGLILDRVRGQAISQRYSISLSGRIVENLGAIAWPGLPSLGDQPPLLFYRTGRAGSGFDWKQPSRDAAGALAVTREGRAYLLDGSPDPVILPDSELAVLDSLLASLRGDPPAWRDTLSVAGVSWEYLRYGDRGWLIPASGGDSAFRAVKAWMERNGLSDPPDFPLGAAVQRFQGFFLDPGYRDTGDTLVLELTPSGQGAEAKEYLTPGSPAYLAGDTLTEVYRLFQDGDTLRIQASSLPAASRLFGRIDGIQALFAVGGLRTVSPAFQDGLPILDGGGNVLSGRIEGVLSGWGRSLASPGVLLDGRGIATGRAGVGFLYTRSGGLERAWRFGGRSGAVTGWNRL